jgi:hypothetical protein
MKIVGRRALADDLGPPLVEPSWKPLVVNNDNSRKTPLARPLSVSERRPIGAPN